MAILKTIEIGQTGILQEDAYTRIQFVTCNHNNRIIFRLASAKDRGSANSGKIFSEEEISVLYGKPEYEQFVSSLNALKAVIYDYIKTLEKYSGAQDVLEPGQ